VASAAVFCIPCSAGTTWWPWWPWGSGGAFLGQPAIWLLPVVFPLVMALGGALGVLGLPLPGVETGIALSALVLGAMVALTVRPP
jgi:urease accessory protein